MHRYAPQAILDIAPHIQVIEKARLLKDEANGSSMGWHEGFVRLPDGVVPAYCGAIRPLQSGQRPQEGRLAATGGTKEGREAFVGQSEVNLQVEVATLHGK
jgi:hypothetical protein